MEQRAGLMNHVTLEHFHLPDEVVAGKTVNLRETLLEQLSDYLALLLRALSLDPTLLRGGVVVVVVAVVW